MASSNAIPGFVVRPPHLAICLLIRLLTSRRESFHIEENSHAAAKLTIFILRLQSKKELYYPSLSAILSQIQQQIGQEGSWIGDFCRQRLSGLTTTHVLTSFIEQLKRDLEGANGMSSLLQGLVPEGRLLTMSRHGVFGLFFRKCIASFHEMSFDQICSLSVEMKEYCPSMIDQEDKSVYLRDYDHLESYVEDHLQEIKRGKIPGNVDRDLESLQPLLEIFPKPVLLQHEMAVIQKEVTSAFHFLRRFCNQSISHGANFLVSNQNTSSNILQRIHILMLKMSSMHISFEHIQESMLVLEEAFESARICNDDGILQSCLVLLLQILIQSSPSVFDAQQVPITKQERFQYIHTLLQRCRSKAIEMRTPHIIAFCELCKASIGVKNHLINDLPANVHEVCKMLGNQLQILHRLRCLVSAGTVVSEAKAHVNDENSRPIVDPLFKSALRVFGPSVKNAPEAVEFIIEQSLAAAQLLCSLGWKASGHIALSQIAALTVEVSLKNKSKISDRASAFAHLATLEATYKGPPYGLKIISYGESVSELANELPLKIAKHYISLGQHLLSSSPDQDQLIKNGMESLASVSSHSFISCIESQIMSEMQNIRSLMALKKFDSAHTEANRIMYLHDMLGLEYSKSEVQLLQATIQDELGVLDLRTAELMEDLSKPQTSPLALLLFCKTLIKLETQSSSLVGDLLKSLLSVVIFQGTLAIQVEYLMLLISSMIKDEQENETQKRMLFALLKRGVELTSNAKAIDQMNKFLQKFEILYKVLSDSNKQRQVLSEMQSICIRNGIQRCQLPDFLTRIETSDAMELG